MKAIITILLLLAGTSATTQVQSTWLGKTPGHRYDWYDPRNWSNQRCPDEFTDVIIPFDQVQEKNYPIYASGKSEINSIRIHPGARLHMQDGELLLLDTEKSTFQPQQIMGYIHKTPEGWYCLPEQAAIAAKPKP